MNRRRFLAAIGVAALARRPVAVDATPMMADQLERLFVDIGDEEIRRETWEALSRTGPLLWKCTIYSAMPMTGGFYAIEGTVRPFMVQRPDEHGYSYWDVYRSTDEKLGARFGYPLASRTPVPAWAFRAS
jgi:hypothetical protein